MSDKKDRDEKGTPPVPPGPGGEPEEERVP